MQFPQRKTFGLNKTHGPFFSLSLFLLFSLPVSFPVFLFFSPLFWLLYAPLDLISIQCLEVRCATLAVGVSILLENHRGPILFNMNLCCCCCRSRPDGRLELKNFSHYFFGQYLKLGIKLDPCSGVLLKQWGLFCLIYNLYCITAIPNNIFLCS